MPKASEREAIIEQLARLLREERLRQERSLNEVAASAGLSRTMVMRVEKRERLPTIDTLLRISEALSIDLWRLLRDASAVQTTNPGLPPVGESDSPQA